MALQLTPNSSSDLDSFAVLEGSMCVGNTFDIPSQWTPPSAATPCLPRTRMARLVPRRRRMVDPAFISSLSPPTPTSATSMPLKPAAGNSASSTYAALLHRIPSAARRAAVHFFSGGLAAGIVRASLQPLDTAKTRLQAARMIGGDVSSVVVGVSAARSRQTLTIRLQRVRNIIFAGGGVQGLYKGVVPGVVGIIPAAAVYMLTFQTLKSRFIRQSGAKQTSLAVATAAALGDVAASLVRVPCEVLKQRLQVGVYANMSDAISEFVKRPSLSGAYVGLGAQLARDVPFAAAEFVVYEQLKTFVRRARNWRLPPADDGKQDLTKFESFAVGAVAGVCAAIASNPSDVVKTRLMTQTGSSAQYRNVLHTFRTVAVDEGLSAFAKGLAPRIAAKALQSALFFTTYETLRRTFSTALNVDMNAQKRV